MAGNTPKLLQEVVQLNELAVGDLQPDQHAPNVCAVVAVVEEAHIPAVAAVDAGELGERGATLAGGATARSRQVIDRGARARACNLSTHARSAVCMACPVSGGCASISFTYASASALRK
jgi:hypothetical protein